MTEILLRAQLLRWDELTATLSHVPVQQTASELC